MDLIDDDDANFNCTPPEVTAVANQTALNLLPEKSRKKYEQTYKAFMDWRVKKNISSFSENVLLAYFGELSEKYKSSSLWSHYSILRSTLSVHNNIKIENYPRLRALLKRKSEHYTPKKSRTFSPENIQKFLDEAPDEVYLVTKVRQF